MFKVTNLDKVSSDIDAWLEAVEKEALRIAVSMMRVLMNVALQTSPQYSGDFAANWQLSVNKVNVFFEEGIFTEKKFPTEDPYQRKDSPAIRYAQRQNANRLDSAKFGDTLWLANSAVHHDLYAWKIEDNLIKLRPVNYGGEGPLRQTREYARHHFARITKQSLEFLK